MVSMCKRTDLSLLLCDFDRGIFLTFSSYCNGLRFNCVKRSGNRAAHAIAKEVVFVSSPREWYTNPLCLYFVVPIFSYNLMN